MADAKFRIILEGDDKDALRDIDNVVKGLNKITQSRNRMSIERQKIAREERKDRFNALRDDEKREKLLNRQIILERQLQRARSQNNLNRVSALELRHAQNRQQLRGIGSGGGGVGAAGLLGGAAAIGGMMGGAVGAAVAVAGAAIVRSMARAVTGSVQFADEISDLADQMGLTRVQVLQIQKASNAAGVGSGKVFASLSALAAARSAALSGDPKAQATFKRYGADPNESNLLKLSQSIESSLGGGGMQSNDRGSMGMLFGRRPELILAALRNITQVSAEIDKSLDTLDKINVKYEVVTNKWKLIMVQASASLFNVVDSLIPKLSKYAATTKAGKLAGFITGNFFADSDPLPLSAEAQARKMARQKRTASSESIPVGDSQGLAIPQADSLARMGLFVGGSGAAGQNLLKQQLMELKAIKEATRNNTRAIDSAFQ